MRRTIQQNKALWKFFQMLADSLNEAGMDMKKTLKPEVDIPWTKDSIHDFIWVPIQKAMIGKESTTEMDKLDPSPIYEVIARHFAEKHGIQIPPWPTE